MKKEATPIIIPTDKQTEIFREAGDKLEYGIASWHSLDIIWYYMYLVTDDRPKNGEWGITYDLLDALVLQYPGGLDERRSWKKIVAITNPELWIREIRGGHKIITPVRGIPKIPQSFIQEYVNKEGKIDKVILEYESLSTNVMMNMPFKEYPKLTPNGEVIVSLIEVESQVSIGIGDGTGDLFVYGKYDTIKILQDKLLRMEKMHTREETREIAAMAWYEGKRRSHNRFKGTYISFEAWKRVTDFYTWFDETYPQ